MGRRGLVSSPYSGSSESERPMSVRVATTASPTMTASTNHAARPITIHMTMSGGPDDPEELDVRPQALRASIVPLHEDLHLVDVVHRAPATDAGPRLEELDPVALLRDPAVPLVRLCCVLPHVHEEVIGGRGRKLEAAHRERLREREISPSVGADHPGTRAHRPGMGPGRPRAARCARARGAAGRAGDARSARPRAPAGWPRADGPRRAQPRGERRPARDRRSRVAGPTPSRRRLRPRRARRRERQSRGRWCRLRSV